MINDIAIISTIFNPTNSERRYRNYLKFQDFIYECGLKEHFYISELLYEDAEPFIKHKNVIRLKMEDILWHKERALNLTCQTLPKQYSKVIWTDIDMIWFNKNWWKDVSRLLDEYNLIQPYSQCRYLRSNFSVGKKIYSHIFHLNFEEKHKTKINGRSFPGGAMAYKREFFENVGLYERDIVGGGDLVSIIPIIKNVPTKYSIFDPNLNEYSEKVKKYVENKYYYLDELICHLYHGILSDRRYKNRYELIENFIFDDLCELGESGLYKFKSHVSNKLKLEYIKYFHDRNEDWEQPIFPLYEPHATEETSKKVIYKWMPPKSEFELHNIKSIKLRVGRGGNLHTSPYLNVAINGRFKQYLLDISKDTEIIIPVSDEKQISNLVFLGKEFIPSKIWTNNDDNRELSYMIYQFWILQHDREEFEEYPLDEI